MFPKSQNIYSQYFHCGIEGTDCLFKSKNLCYNNCLDFGLY